MQTKLLLVLFCILALTQGILGHGSCPLCKKLGEERCRTGTKSSGLCQQIAHSTCPTAILQGRLPPKPPKPKPVKICPNDDSDESFEVSSKKAKKDEKGVFDLLSGILVAVHTHSKANVKHAREKELKEAILGKKLQD